MLRFLPVGFIGLMVGGLIAANSSTILTHLNWGASYLVHDFYRRFVRPDASEPHYVAMGRIATVVLYLCAAALTFVLDTAKDAFDLILQIGAGTGLLYLARWFWWRVNAWCEVAAMISSFAISAVFIVSKKQHLLDFSAHSQLLITIAVTTVCWLLTAFLAPATDRSILVEFYKKVRPPGPGWSTIKHEARAPEHDARDLRDNIPLSLLGWLSGSILIWSALFTIGNFLYGRVTYALLLGASSIISGAVLFAVLRKLWSGSESR
jgi:Na+/proline symporter